VSDGEDRLQIWKTNPTRLNKQLQTANMTLPQAWGMGEGPTTPYGKKKKKKKLQNVI
jgi:hypothetical protein